MNMNNVKAVFLKQVRDTLKNKTIFIQFVMFPVLVIIMENAVKLNDMPEHFFAKLFAVMYMGMAPLTSMSSVISEEKEKNTLRVLMMSNVKPAEYLLGVGAYIFSMCTVGTAVFAAVGGYRGSELALFIGVISAGIILSELIGAVIGVFSRNQMTATSLTVPVMMVFSFLPMLSMFNETIKKFAKFSYSQQISDLINNIGGSGVSAENMAVIGVNLIAAAVLFIFAYRRKGLET